LCGGISQYNNPQGMFGAGPKNYFKLILRNARMEGFIVLQFAKRFPEAVAELAKWQAEGKIKNQLDVAHGLENAPKTLIRVFTGANLGKQVLQLATL
jgi:NADPH-dependent curcumin reductase CurA